MTIQNIEIVASSRQAPLIQDVMALLDKHDFHLYGSEITYSKTGLPIWLVRVAPMANKSNTSGRFESDKIGSLVESIKNKAYTIKTLVKSKLADLPEKDQYIITLVAPEKLGENTYLQFKHLTDTIATIRKSSFSGTRSAEIHFICNKEKMDDLKRESQFLAGKSRVDFIIHHALSRQRSIKLAAFDMDSTLIQAEVIDEMAREAGQVEKVSEITEMAMQGEINFNESLEKRLALLADLPVTCLENVLSRISLSPGAERLIKVLRALGCQTAIISGGFTWFARKFQKMLAMDHVHANELEISNGKLTGRVKGKIVDGSLKKQGFEYIIKKNKVSQTQTLAAGDGANDIPMLQTANYGIAFHPKPVLRPYVNTAISYGGLDTILYMLGWHDEEIKHILETSSKAR